ALEQVFTTHHQALEAVNAAGRQQPVLLPDGSVAVPVPPPPTPPAEQARTAQRAARRQARYDAVWALHRQGWSTAALAAQVGCSRRTIERYLQITTWRVIAYEGEIEEDREKRPGLSRVTSVSSHIGVAWQVTSRTMAAEAKVKNDKDMLPVCSRSTINESPTAAVLSCQLMPYLKPTALSKPPSSLNTTVQAACADPS